MKGALYILFLLISLICHGQRRDTLRFFFEINERVSAVHTQRIDSLADTFGTNSYNVWIYGYADFLHHYQYNKALSEARARGIRDQLLRRSSEPQLTVMACEGRGESRSHDNGSLLGEPFQRRVDLIIELRPVNKVVDTRPSKLRKVDTLHQPSQIDVQELKRTGKLVLEGLSFIPGRHTLFQSSLPVLQGLLTTMLQNPELRIEIQGHICCWQGHGDAYDYDSDDMRLSHNRAKAVYDYLVENGVEAHRMEFKGYGHSRPKVREINAQTEQMNRRVEIRVLN